MVLAAVQRGLALLVPETLQPQPHRREMQGDSALQIWERRLIGRVLAAEAAAQLLLVEMLSVIPMEATVATEPQIPSLALR